MDRRRGGVGREIWVVGVQLHRERAEMRRGKKKGEGERERQEAGNQLSRQNVEYV